MKHTAILEDDIFLLHLTGKYHPESPQRFAIAKKALIDRGLYNPQLDKIPLRIANDSEILLCHTNEYLDIVSANIERCRELHIDDGSYQLSTGDVQVGPMSDLVARHAVGALLQAVDIVMSGTSTRAFCLVRPPGHHACSNRGMGFCIYNNISIAARYASQKYGLERILIVDWDVHHGNGTEEIFFEDPSVFYFSTHNSLIYPGTGKASDIGRGKGEGYTLNVPIHPNQNPAKKMKEAFLHLTQVMENYKPQLVLISAGFDAHILDPLGGFNLSTQDFVDLTHIVNEISQKYSQSRVISALEGGYNLQALSEVIPAFLHQGQG